MSKRFVILIYLSIVFLVVGCASDGPPAGIMTEAQMVPVLADLEVVYAGVDQTVKDPRERVKKYEEMNSLILKKHNVDHEQFYSSYQWYEANPVLLDTIFKQVVMRLNDDLTQLQGAEAAKPRPKPLELK